MVNNKLYISQNLIFPKDYTLEISSDAEIILEGNGNLIIQSDIIYLNNDFSDEKSKHMINFKSKEITVLYLKII